MQTLGALGAFAAAQEGGQPLDLTTVETDRPVLKSGIVPFTILESKTEPGKKDPATLNWVLVLGTTAPLISTAEKPVPAGHKLTVFTGLVATGKRTSDMVFADVVRVLDAVYGESVARKIDLNTFDLQSVVGATITGKVLAEPEQTDTVTGQLYPAKNSVRFVKKAE